MTRKQRRALVKSRAAIQIENRAVNKIVEELKASLIEANIREEELEKQVAQLKSQLKSARSELKRQKATNIRLRETTASIVKGFDETVKKHISSALSPRKKKDKDNDASIEKIDDTNREIVKKAKCTKAEWIEQNKLNFISQFFNRLSVTFPDTDKEMLNALKNKMKLMSSVEIDKILIKLDNKFRTMYYESNSYAFFEGQGQEYFMAALFEAFNIAPKEEATQITKAA